MEINQCAKAPRFEQRNSGQVQHRRPASSSIFQDADPGQGTKPSMKRHTHESSLLCGSYAHRTATQSRRASMNGCGLGAGASTVQGWRQDSRGRLLTRRIEAPGRCELGRHLICIAAYKVPARIFPRRLLPVTELPSVGWVSRH